MTCASTCLFDTLFWPFEFASSFCYFFPLLLISSPYIKQNLGLVIYYRVRFLFLSLWNIVSLSKVTMSEAKTQIESIRKWVVEHKLRTVGNFLNLALHSFFLIDGCLILLISILLWFFAIVIWIRVSMAQWYYGFDRLQLVSTQHEN